MYSGWARLAAVWCGESGSPSTRNDGCQVAPATMRSGIRIIDRNTARAPRQNPSTAMRSALSAPVALNAQSKSCWMPSSCSDISHCPHLLTERWISRAVLRIDAQQAALAVVQIRTDHAESLGGELGHEGVRGVANAGTVVEDHHGWPRTATDGGNAGCLTRMAISPSFVVVSMISSSNSMLGR